MNAKYGYRGRVVTRQGKIYLIKEVSNGNARVMDTAVDTSNILITSEYTKPYVEVKGIQFKVEQEGDDLFIVESFNKGELQITGALECKLWTLEKHIEKLIDQVTLDLAKKEKIVETGVNMRPETVILEPVVVELKVNTNGNMVDTFNDIVGNISSLTESINKDFSLNDTKELAKAFLEAKGKIEALSAKKNKATGVFSSMVAKIPYGKKVVASVKETMAENTSVHKNIDYLFGLVHEKYEKLITVGEGLQQSKGHISAQIVLLEKLLIESNTYLDGFGEAVNVPMREMSLNSQIKASVEKFRGRLLKIDGAIMATQTTIVALGKDLPSLKTDLTDEMAIGGLLTSVDDYQVMFSEIAGLVAEVTKTTSEKTHEVIENLFDLQINNNYTRDHLADSSMRTEKFAKMVVDKSGKLKDKVISDAAFMAEIADGKSIENARLHIKMIEGGEGNVS